MIVYRKQREAFSVKSRACPSCEEKKLYHPNHAFGGKVFDIAYCGGCNSKIISVDGELSVVK